MIDLERMYSRLPIWLQQRAIDLEGWRINRSRYTKVFYSHLNEYKQRSSLDPTDLIRYRDLRIHAFVQHCVESVPYYRDLFRNLSISPEDIKTLKDLSLLPILEKQTVQDRYSEFLSEKVSPSKRIQVHTSGTTGGGLHFATTEDALAEQWAVWWKYRNSHGIKTGTLCGYFAGRTIVPAHQKYPPFWRHNHPGNQIMFSGYHMNPANLASYIAKLREARPPWLHGYPSLLSLLAAYLLESGKDLGYQVKWITIGAENLMAYQVKLIRDAFGIHAIQHYGMAEAVANISETFDGQLKVDEEFAAVEFISNPQGLGHKIIGTNLSNLATPLLRYDTQDIVEVIHPGSKVAKIRIVGSIDGREEDYIVLPDGTRLGRMDHIFKDMTHIREAQLIQNEIGQVDIKIVRTSKFDFEDEENLIREFKARIGDETYLKIEYVSEIRRSSRAKLRFVISNIPAAQLYLDP